MILKFILILSLVEALVAMQAVSARKHHRDLDRAAYGPGNASPTGSFLTVPSPAVSNSLTSPNLNNPSRIPANVRAFYQKVLAGGSCSPSNELKSPFFATEYGPRDFCYCDEFMENKGFYIRGTGRNLAPMAVDCDGNQKGLTKRCGSSKDIQSQTAFQSNVQQEFGIPDLRADIHPYVVLGNSGSKPGFTTFDPQTVGVRPLSVVAVVCNSKLIFGIWGDTNGDDGPPLVGEASIAVATACFGNVIDGNNGHDQNDVLYIAFSGSHAVPGKTANWNANTYEEFEQSITDLGNALVASL